MARVDFPLSIPMKPRKEDEIFGQLRGWGVSEWPSFERLSQAIPELAWLDKSPQSESYHSEGDVKIHTMMMLECHGQAKASQGWSDAVAQERFWAALLHDCAKPETSVWEEGEWRNPKHSPLGEIRARHILWRLGAPMDLRERVCASIRKHQAPFLFKLEDEAVGAKLDALALRQDTHALFDLARLDLEGRATRPASLREDALARLEIFTEMSAERGALGFIDPKGPMGARRWSKAQDGSYWVDQPDGAQPKNFLMLLSAPPASGKSSLAQALSVNLGARLLSLDAQREALGAKADEGAARRAVNQGIREALAQGESVILDVTSLRASARQAWVDLAEAYGAASMILCLDPPPLRELYDRDRARGKVGWQDLRGMLSAWSAPMGMEAAGRAWVGQDWELAARGFLNCGFSPPGLGPALALAREQRIRSKSFVRARVKP